MSFESENMLTGCSLAQTEEAIRFFGWKHDTATVTLHPLFHLLVLEMDVVLSPHPSDVTAALITANHLKHDKSDGEGHKRQEKVCDWSLGRRQM